MLEITSSSSPPQLYHMLSDESNFDIFLSFFQSHRARKTIGHDPQNWRVKVISSLSMIGNHSKANFWSGTYDGTYLLSMLSMSSWMFFVGESGYIHHLCSICIYVSMWNAQPTGDQMAHGKLPLHLRFRTGVLAKAFLCMRGENPCRGKPSCLQRKNECTYVWYLHFSDCPWPQIEGFGSCHCELRTSLSISISNHGNRGSAFYLIWYDSLGPRLEYVSVFTSCWVWVNSILIASYVISNAHDCDLQKANHLW